VPSVDAARSNAVSSRTPRGISRSAGRQLRVQLDADLILALEELPRGAELIFLAGSLVEGLGNPWSDIDCYVIGNTEPIGPHVLQMAQFKVSTHFVERERVDFEFWTRAEVVRICKKLELFDPNDWRDSDLLSQAQQAFVHRLHNALVLYGDLAAVGEIVNLEKLSLMQKCAALSRLDGAFEDVCGMLEGDDLISALALSRHLLDLSMDVYLHALGRTNPSGKWRLRMLGAYPLDEKLKQRWLSLYFPSSTLVHDDSAARNFVIDVLKCSE
jgi:predicted nucleotidyltransferase